MVEKKKQITLIIFNLFKINELFYSYLLTFLGGGGVGLSLKQL